VKSVHIVGFITKILVFVTMHGHMNVKKNINRLKFVKVYKFVFHAMGSQLHYQTYLLFIQT